MKTEEIMNGLWRIEDTCNVYLVKKGDSAIAIDFGSGEWLGNLDEFGIKQIDHVFLTHHHADQCWGLQKIKNRDFTVHAPIGDNEFLDPDNLNEEKFDILGIGCPVSYAVLKKGIPDISYDMGGFGRFFWGNERLRFHLTPGHGPNATSIILDHNGQQIVFCGDAAYTDAKIWQPFNLEWDHWTGRGALAAWEGINRLSNLGIDLLCPSHGPIIKDNPPEMLKELARRLMEFYQVKGAISPGEKDCYLKTETLEYETRKISKHLYAFGSNAYLLISDTGEGLVFDFVENDLPYLEALFDEIGEVKITASMVSHYHGDHSGGIPLLRKKFGAKAVLHEKVAEPIADINKMTVPFLPKESIETDEILSGRGVWKWNDYEISYNHWPGQTWWHAVYFTIVDGQKVVFCGDSFQPASQWNGTGGFCAYNRSKFREGFIKSAEYLMELDPDIMAAGHKSTYKYKSAKFAKVILWAEKAEKVLTTLCPSGNLDNDYYHIPAIAEPKSPASGNLFWVK